METIAITVVNDRHFVPVSKTKIVNNLLLKTKCKLKFSFWVEYKTGALLMFYLVAKNLKHKKQEENKLKLACLLCLSLYLLIL